MEDASARNTARSWRLAVQPRDAWFLVLAAVVIAADQLTKWIIRANIERGDAVFDLGFFRIVHVLNTGAAFGMLQGAGSLLIITSVVGMAALVIYLFNPGFAHPIMRAGLALMLGGAIGNLIDRLRTGEVVDFLKVPNWPAFNIADSAITVGVVVLIWGMLREQSQPESETSENS